MKTLGVVAFASDIVRPPTEFDLVMDGSDERRACVVLRRKWTFASVGKRIKYAGSYAGQVTVSKLSPCMLIYCWLLLLVIPK